MTTNMQTIAVCGVGRLGLPLALNFERSRQGRVIGFDVDQAYVKRLNERSFRSDEPGVNELLAGSRIEFTTKIDELQAAELLIVCVRTDSLTSGAYDLAQLWRFIDALVENTKTATHSAIKAVAINCNVNPGTSRKISQILGPLGIEVYFWPEWVKQGSIIFDQTHPDVSVLGRSAGYQTINAVVEVISSLDVDGDPGKIHQLDLIDAELAKIALNCFLTVKISFANMMANLLDEIGVDPVPVLRAVGEDTRVGQKFFRPGFGYGGPCLPRDNAALVNFAALFGVEMPLCVAADKVNLQRHQTLLKNAAREYHTSGRMSEVESLSYKEGISIFTESQQLRLASDLASLGIPVIVSNPDERNLGSPLIAHGEYLVRAPADRDADEDQGDPGPKSA